MIDAKTIPVGSFGANCVVLTRQENATRAILADPGQDAADLIAWLDENGLSPEAILLTHGHFDHITAVPDLQKRWPGMPVAIHPLDEPMLGHPMNLWPPEYPATPKPANLVDVREWAKSHPEWSLEILHTPGHTPGSCCFLFTADALLLSGDTLFAGSCGRTDFPGGNAEEMAASLKRLARLPPETRVVPGHGASTTIARETASNPFM